MHSEQLKPQEKTYGSVESLSVKKEKVSSLWKVFIGVSVIALFGAALYVSHGMPRKEINMKIEVVEDDIVIAEDDMIITEDIQNTENDEQDMVEDPDSLFVGDPQGQIDWNLVPQENDDDVQLNEDAEISEMYTDAQLASRYAPYIYFDKNQAKGDASSPSWGFPMNAQIYYRKMVKGEDFTHAQLSCARNDGQYYCENRNWGELANGRVPLYYQVLTCSGGQKRIVYSLLFGYQHQCIGGKSLGWQQGHHHGGFEKVAVIVSKNHQFATGVIFKQHNGWYLRRRGNFDSYGTHAIVYVGGVAHGTYHDSRCGSVNSCPYFDDFRCVGYKWQTWKYLIEAKFDSINGGQVWLAETGSNYNEDTLKNKYNLDSHSGGMEFLSKANTYYKDANKNNWCDKLACKGKGTTKLSTAGCWKASCLSQNDERYVNPIQGKFKCVKPCGKGYKKSGVSVSGYDFKKCVKRGCAKKFYKKGGCKIKNPEFYEVDYKIPYNDL